MNVSLTSTGSLTEALDDLNKQLTKAQKSCAVKMAGIGRRLILTEAKRHRGTLTMSGMMRRDPGRKVLGAKVHKYVNPTRAVVTIRGVMGGPWAIVEYGTVRGSPATYTWARSIATVDTGDLDRAIAELFDDAVEVAMGAVGGGG
jgi:hypothetical protein